MQLPNFFNGIYNTIAQWVSPGSLAPSYQGHELIPVSTEYPWTTAYQDKRLDAEKLLAIMEMGIVDRLLWQIIDMILNGRDIQAIPPVSEDSNALSQQANEVKQDLLAIDRKLDMGTSMARGWIDFVGFGSGLIELGLPIDETGKVIDWSQIDVKELNDDQKDKLVKESDKKTLGWGQIETRDGVTWQAPEWMLPLDAFSFATLPPICTNPWKYVPGRMLPGIVWDIDAKEMMYWQVQRFGVQIPTRIPAGRILQIKDKKARYNDGKSYVAGIAATAAQLEAVRKSLMQSVMTHGAQRLIIKVNEQKDAQGTPALNPFGKKNEPRFKTAYDSAGNFVKNYNNNSAGVLWGPDHDVIWAPGTNLGDATTPDEYLKKEILNHLIPRDFIEQNGAAVSKSSGPLLDLMFLVIHAWRDIISAPFEELYNQILEANGFTGWKCKFTYTDPDISDSGPVAQRSLDACKNGLITLDRYYQETDRDPIQEDERKKLLEWHSIVTGGGIF